MVMTTATRYTPAEYLALEEQATVKHELIEGDRIPMAGASANHNRLTANLCRLLPLKSVPVEVALKDLYQRVTFAE